MTFTNLNHMERWLGREKVEEISANMTGWYGPPIAVHGVPGAVYANGDGNFTGECREGFEATALDRAWDLGKRLKRGARIATSPKRAQLNAGFASLSDLIAEATGGKRQELFFLKVGSTGVGTVSNSLWGVGNMPVAGAAGSAAPGGRAPTDATTGAMPFVNAGGGDTLHFVSGFPQSTVNNSSLLLYDRIFDVAKTMNSTTTEAVTGVPTRYQSTTAGAADYIGGNFLFVEVGATQLAGTAHNWTVCTYKDQADGASTLPSLTGNSAAIVTRFDHPVGQWFAPLESGDSGVKALTQMQCSALVATGLINFVIGHPIAWMPCIIANLVTVTDGINTAFNLARIFDDAALAFIEACKPSTTAANYTGSLTLVAG